MYRTTTTTVSLAVAAIIAKKIQLDTTVAMMLDPELNRKDYGSAVRRAAVETANEERSLKTWQNYVSAARAAHSRAVVQYPERLPSMKTLKDWVTSQLTAGGFATSNDDVANWAHGRDSLRDRDAKAKKEAAEAAEKIRAWQLRNQNLRNQQIQEQAKQSSERESEVRSRAVAVDYEAANADAKQYLRGQYTEYTGVMFCQVCKGEMPFKLANGEYYFEAVVIAKTLGKSLRETYLALCPNCAAKFRHANEQKDEMLELIATSTTREINLVLGGSAVTVRFSETHLADIKSCLEAEGLVKTVKPPQSQLVRGGQVIKVTRVRKGPHDV